MIQEPKALLADSPEEAMSPCRTSILFTIVPNGFQALLKIGQKTPDLLITDLIMSELDGYRMLQTLREPPGFKSMAIVVATGLDQAEIEAHGGLPADNKFYPKPIPINAVGSIAESMAAAKQTAKRANST